MNCLETSMRHVWNYFAKISYFNQTEHPICICKVDSILCIHILINPHKPRMGPDILPRWNRYNLDAAEIEPISITYAKPRSGRCRLSRFDIRPRWPRSGRCRMPSSGRCRMPRWTRLDRYWANIVWLSGGIVYLAGAVDVHSGLTGSDCWIQNFTTRDSWLRVLDCLLD